MSSAPSSANFFGLERYGLSAGRIVLAAVLFLSFLPAIAPPDVDLDPSWRLMLGYAFEHHLQFGRDFIFTYGPLGFLLTNANDGRHLAVMLVWNFCVAGGFAWAFMVLIRRFSLARQVVAYVFLLTLAREKEDLYVFILLLAGFSLLRAAAPGRRQIVVTMVFFAILSLTKFTFGMLAGVIVAACVAQAWWERRRSDAIWLGATYAATFLGLWMLCRQNPLNLPAYLFHSVEISLGYAAAMSLPTPDRAFLLAIATVGGLLVHALCKVFVAGDRRRGLVHAAVFAFATFVIWKHGFVRADGHMIYFWDFAMFCGVFSPLLLPGASARNSWADGVAAAAGITAFFGLAFNFPVQVTYALETLNADLRERIGELAAPRDFAAKLRQGWTDAVEKNSLKRTREAVGNATVDVLSFYQGIAILNGLNFAPRPVPQGYSAYTPRLAALNAAHYESAGAPEWVLQRTETINGQFPTLDDAALLPALLRNYEFRSEDGTYLLWQKSTPANRYDRFRPTPGPTKRGRLEQPVPLDDLAGRNIWARLHLHPTLLGRLRAFFYKPAELTLDFADNTGHTETFRLNPNLAPSGFLLNPLLRDRFDWMRFLRGLPCLRAQSITVKVADGSRAYFRRDFDYEFDGLPEAPHRQTEQDALLLAQTGKFENLPVSVSAAAPLGPAICGGEPAVLVHAPCEMTFNVERGATSLHGRFGIADNAYTGDAHTEGARVVVEWTDLAGTRTLFERRLDPLHNAGDRGLQELNVDLKGLGPGILTIRDAIATSNKWAWTVWRDVAVLPATIVDPKGKPALTASNNILMRFGRFAEVPLSVHAGAPIAAVVVNGLPMVQTHPDSEIALLVPDKAKRAVGRFALHEGSYSNGGSTDGVGFSVIWKLANDERVLFRQFLNPMKIGTDRGIHQFNVDLSGLPAGGLLLLRTDPGPAGDHSWDWACWSDVAVGDPAPIGELDSLAIARTAAALLPDSSAGFLPASLFKDSGGFKTVPTLVTALNTPAPAMIGDFHAVQVHPPSDMVVPLGENPSALRVQFGMQRAALDQTDGVDYEIEWTAPGGQKRMLYQRGLRPATAQEDRLVQRIEIPLAGLSGGELHFRIGCGPHNNTSFDWACWQGLEVDGALPNSADQEVPYVKSRPPSAPPARTIKLSAADAQVVGFNLSPVEFDGPVEPVIATVAGEKALQVHAPGKMVIPLPPHAKSVTGRFGFQDGAYASDSPTDGAVFIVYWAGSDGTKKELYRHSLAPTQNNNDRGLHGFQVSLDGLGAGDLIFVTDPGPDKNNASDWTCWRGIKIE